VAINKLNIGLISNTASDGNEGVTDQHVLTYVAANNSVEFKELSLTVAGVGTVSSNADAVNTQLTANIDTVQDNVTSTVSLLSSSNTNIDTVQANLDTFATYANTNYAADAANSFSTITVGSSNVVATTTTDNVIFATGNGISILANADSQSLTFSMYAGDIKSDYFTLDGTANTVTLSTDNRPDYTLYVTVGGLIQEPGINYVVNSTTLTLNNTYPILNGTDVEVRYLPYTGEIAAVTAGGSSSPGIIGSSFGYVTGGSPANNPIQKFPFSSDSSSTNIGTTILSRQALAGHSSLTHGYSSGGSTTTIRHEIDKFSFTSDGNATDVGELLTATKWHGGQSSSSHGYISGGFQPTVVDTIGKFPFSSDTGTADVGELTQARYTGAAQSSPSHGYYSGGQSPARVNTIDKFPFSSDASASAVGDLTVTKMYGAGNSSSTHGYTSGGTDYVGSPADTDTIEKFSFSSDSNSTDVGELLATTTLAATQNSTVSGYVSNGTVIQKFPFSSDASAADVGELVIGVTQAAGQQV